MSISASTTPPCYRRCSAQRGGASCDIHLSANATSLFQKVMDVLSRGRSDGGFRHRPVRDHATACWSLLHGVTMLAIDGLLLPEKVGLKPLEAAFGTLMEGISGVDHAKGYAER